MLSRLLLGVVVAVVSTADAASQFPPSGYHYSGDLYFQYYGSLYHMPGGFQTGNWSSAARTKVIVTWGDSTNNTGKFDSNHVQFCGPVVDESNPNLLYIIGRALPVSSGYHIVEVDVTNGPSSATGRILYNFTYSYGLRDAAMGWDPYEQRLFWCHGESVSSSSNYGKCFTFKPNVDTQPQDFGNSGIGTYTKVGNGVRGPATIQDSNGTKYVYLSGKEGVWRQEIGVSGVLGGTNLVKLVDQSAHEVFGGAADVDQFGYGLKYVNATDELWYVSNNRGIFRLQNPKDAPASGDSLPLWSFQGHSDHTGLAFDATHHMVYGLAKGLLGSQPDCGNAAAQWFRVDAGWASDADRSSELKQPQVVEFVNNCDLDNSGNTDYLALSWMVVAGPATGSSSRPIPREVDRRANVTGNGLNSSFMQGVVMHVTEIKSGVYEYVWSDVANHVSQTIFVCDDEGGGARSNMVFDRKYGWLYVICQQRLLRIDAAGLINAGYGVEGSGISSASVDRTGIITPTPGAGQLIEIIHDTMQSASSDQDIGQLPQTGWHGYELGFAYGSALSLVDGVLFWTTRQMKATVYPTFDLGLWAWRLGRDTAWVPIALIPGTPGANQAGAVKGDLDGNLYLSIGNQVVDEVNGIWMISNAFDLFGELEVRQVLTVTGALANAESQVYGFELEMNTSTGLPQYAYMSMANDSLTTYSDDASTLARVPWTGNASHGMFVEEFARPLGDVYHRGHCTFGCGVWTLLGINIDPTTNIFWLNYYNGDGDQFITTYSPATGKVSDACYFYAAAASVTHPKFSTLLTFGAAVSSLCPCFSKNGISINAVPGSTAIGYCSRGVWMTPLLPGADELGRCNVDRCLDCDPATSPGSCEGFLQQCSIDCCNSGYSDGTWDFVGWGGAADYFRAQQQCTGQRDSVPTTTSGASTVGAISSGDAATTGGVATTVSDGETTMVGATSSGDTATTGSNETTTGSNETATGSNETATGSNETTTGTGETTVSDGETSTAGATDAATTGGVVTTTGTGETTVSDGEISTVGAASSGDTATTGGDVTTTVAGEPTVRDGETTTTSDDLLNDSVFTTVLSSVLLLVGLLGLL